MNLYESLISDWTSDKDFYTKFDEILFFISYKDNDYTEKGYNLVSYHIHWCDAYKGFNIENILTEIKERGSSAVGFTEVISVMRLIEKILKDNKE